MQISAASETRELWPPVTFTSARVGAILADAEDLSGMTGKAGRSPGGGVSPPSTAT